MSASSASDRHAGLPAWRSPSSRPAPLPAPACRGDPGRRRPVVPRGPRPGLRRQARPGAPAEASFGRRAPVRNTERQPHERQHPVPLSVGAGRSQPGDPSFTASPACGCAPLEATSPGRRPAPRRSASPASETTSRRTAPSKFDGNRQRRLRPHRHVPHGPDRSEAAAGQHYPSTPAPTPAPATAAVRRAVVSGILPAGTGPARRRVREARVVRVHLHRPGDLLGLYRANHARDRHREDHRHRLLRRRRAPTSPQTSSRRAPPNRPFDSIPVGAAGPRRTSS